MRFIPKTPKNRDRFFDGVKAVFVAVLITLGGTVVTNSSNYYTSFLTQKRQIADDARKDATAISRKMTNKMNDRYLYAKRCVSAYNWQVDQEKGYAEYDEAVKRWNVELITDLSDVRNFFGKEKRQEIIDIIKKFGKINDKITQLHNASVHNEKLPSDIGTFLEQNVYPMDDIISDFADKMHTQLQEGKVAIYNPAPPISKPMGVEEVKH